MDLDLNLERERLNPHHEECLRIHHCWPWFFFLGIATIGVGIAAISSACTATLATVTLFGYLLLAGGIIQIVNAFLARNWRGFFLLALIGLLHFFAGELMIEHPGKVAEVLTVMLAIAFLVGGVARLIYCFMHSFPGQTWVLFSGLITLLLGLSIWRQLPESSEFIIGLFIGIDLIFSGLSWVMLGLAIKSLAPAKKEMQSQDA